MIAVWSVYIELIQRQAEEACLVTLPKPKGGKLGNSPLWASLIGSFSGNDLYSHLLWRLGLCVETEQHYGIITAAQLAQNDLLLVQNIPEMNWMVATWLMIVCLFQAEWGVAATKCRAQARQNGRRGKFSNCISNGQCQGCAIKEVCLRRFYERPLSQPGVEQSNPRVEVPGLHLRRMHSSFRRSITRISPRRRFTDSSTPLFQCGLVGAYRCVIPRN